MARKSNSNKKVVNEPINVDSDSSSHWIEYWKQLQEATNDSEEKLDGKTFAIATGGIGLLLGIMGIGHERISVGIGYAITALSAFAIALLMNLCYYKKTIKNHNKQFEKIGEYIRNHNGEDDDYLYAMIEKDNRGVDRLSSISLFFNIVGIIFFAVYVVILNFSA